MRCPTIVELPSPPLNRIGWPWTEESPQLPETMPDGSLWPRISIVTPSFNQGRFIEETIRSVLLQGYPNLEYIIIDGCSSDETIRILNKYEQWFAYCVSEPDHGQSNAINKGFAHSTGKIMAYLNSDDFYLPGVFSQVAQFIQKGHNIIGGDELVVNEMSEVVGQIHAELNLTDKQIFSLVRSNKISSFRLPQPALFWTRDIWEKAGSFNEELNYVMDFEFVLLSLSVGGFPFLSHTTFTSFRLHPQSKSVGKRKHFNLEGARVLFRLAFDKKFIFFPCLLAGFQQIGWHFRSQIRPALIAGNFPLAFLSLLLSIILYPTIPNAKASTLHLVQQISSRWEHIPSK